MSRLAYWHCLAGISGDMCLGALVDAGVPLATLQQAVDALGVEPVRLHAEPVTRAGTPATRVRVDAAGADAPHRDWARIQGLLGAATLPPAVRDVAVRVFARLAEAEAAVHHSRPERVQFHEVGALDALADIVGTAAGLAALGVTESAASTVTTGLGVASGDHGTLPVPAPAVLRLLADAGAPVRSGPVPAEMCTPTGAAVLTATVSHWGELPPVRVVTSGIGAGGRDHPDLPNVVQLIVGEPVAAAGSDRDSVVLEANVDDLDPRLWPTVLARLLGAGAADAWLTPILMKKGRPAHTVHVLADPSLVGKLRGLLFTETSTIGVRAHPVSKAALQRAVHTVQVDGHPIRVKVAMLDGRLVGATPEYEDVAALAERSGRAVKAVLAAASAAADAAGLVPGAPGETPA